MIIDRKDDIMNDSIYYKATDEDGNTVLKHGWKNHKYLYIKNGRYVYPEDVKKNAKKAAKFVKKVATRDAAFKMAATKYLVDKAVNSPTANAAKSKARSVVSKAEYKIERAGQKLSDDANNAYKSAKKRVKTTANAAKSKARSVVSKAEYKLTRAGEKLTNDVKSSGAYKSAKKEINRTPKNAKKAYKTSNKTAKKVNRTLNKVNRSGKAYLDYLTK